MLLRSRPATLDDLVSQREALAFAYGHDRALLARMPEVWAAWLPMRSIWSIAVEDLDRAADRRVVFLGLTAFISEDLGDRLASGKAPVIGGQVARQFLEAGGGPLTLAELAEGQSGEGLCSVNLHSVCPLVRPGEAAPLEIAEFAAAQNFRDMRGYRFASCLRDVFSADSRKAYEGGGWRLRTTNGVAEPSPTMPHVLGIDRAEAKASTGARMATMFVDYRRRLDLRLVHRDLLEAALLGLTDDEIAERLSVTLSAVKKRWTALYDHVEARAPQILPEQDPFTRSGRGVERRRHLLAYIREHPEELVVFGDSPA